MIDYQNPFPNDPDRAEIWDMLVARDIQAFIIRDWDRVANDFIEEGFMAIDALGKANPDFWSMKFATLADYRSEWLRQANIFCDTSWQEDPEKALYLATQMRDIEITGNVGLAHKKFDGCLHNQAGEKSVLNWQTLYRCRKVKGHWKIAGFIGYMPYHSIPATKTPNSIQRPKSAAQHVTAGPYSPVLELRADTFVVISGQAAINEQGVVVGDTIEEQTKHTLENCKQQLRSAGVTLDDVFKVNVFLADLDLWPRFNEIYKTYFTDPLPVRTAIGCNLLMTLLVEIELWAIKN